MKFNFRLFLIMFIIFYLTIIDGYDAGTVKAKKEEKDSSIKNLVKHLMKNKIDQSILKSTLEIRKILSEALDFVEGAIKKAKTCSTCIRDYLGIDENSIPDKSDCQGKNCTDKINDIDDLAGFSDLPPLSRLVAFKTFDKIIGADDDDDNQPDSKSKKPTNNTSSRVKKPQKQKSDMTVKPTNQFKNQPSLQTQTAHPTPPLQTQTTHPTSPLQTQTTHPTPPAQHVNPATNQQRPQSTPPIQNHNQNQQLPASNLPQSHQQTGHQPATMITLDQYIGDDGNCMAPCSQSCAPSCSYDCCHNAAMMMNPQQTMLQQQLQNCNPQCFDTCMSSCPTECCNIFPLMKRSKTNIVKKIDSGELELL